jgi:ketosteroid isomerase-like protein
MPQKDTEVVRSIYERWNRDPAALAAALARGETDYDDFGLELIDPAVEVRQAGALLDSAGSFHGHAGMILAAKELHEAFETISWVPEEWSQEGEWVIVTVRMIAVGEHSGLETETRVFHSWRAQDGKATHFHVHMSAAQAIEAARHPD